MAAQDGRHLLGVGLHSLGITGIATRGIGAQFTLTAAGMPVLRASAPTSSAIAAPVTVGTAGAAAEIAFSHAVTCASIAVHIAARAGKPFFVAYAAAACISAWANCAPFVADRLGRPAHPANSTTNNSTNSLIASLHNRRW